MWQLPQLQKMWEEYRGKGLHLFHVETQNHSQEQVASFLKRFGVTFPNPILNESEFPLVGNGAPLGWGYDCQHLPKTYVIGVDGNVIWEGRFGYDEVLEEELKKVRYPGLFKQEVAKELRPAARLFGAGKYGKAIAEAEKKLQNLQDEDAVADAELIIERAMDIAGDVSLEVDELLADRRYAPALPRLEELAASFKGHYVGKEAAQDLADLEKDPLVKKEVKASRNLAKLVEAARDSDRKPASVAKRLRSFAHKHEGLRAAEDALALAEKFEGLAEK